MFEAIKKVVAQDYDHEQPDIPRSKAFNRAYKAYVNSQIKPLGYSLVKSKGIGYCDCTGFITDNKGHYVYFSSGDYRWEPIYERVLIRSAESETDYRGGANHFVELKDIGKEVERLMN